MVQGLGFRVWGFPKIRGTPQGFGTLGFRVISGVYGDNGKENGNYYNGLYRV